MNSFSNTLAILVHGFGCAPRHLSVWERTLQTQFPNVLVPALPATHGSFELCLDVLTQELAKRDIESFDNVFFAGHSMGGLLARAFLAKYRPRNAARLVVVGSPHYGSPLADVALKVPFAGRVFPALYAFMSSHPVGVVSPDVPGLAIASIEGSANTLGWGKLFLPDDSDGRVLLSSAYAPDAREHLQLALNHNELMSSEAVAQAILNFFVSGSLKNA